MTEKTREPRVSVETGEDPDTVVVSIDPFHLGILWSMLTDFNDRTPLGIETKNAILKAIEEWRAS